MENEALTDEEAKINWEKYVNPNGPGAMSFGMALLPTWIVEVESSIWLRGLFALVFMVAVPTAVGTWWYRSRKFSRNQVLLDTTDLFLYLLHETTDVNTKRAIMILAASYEYDRKFNKEIIERTTDEDDVPALLHDLGETNKDHPPSRAYFIKARALLHAHLTRMPLKPQTLEKDRQLVVRKAPYLILEIVNCANQLIALAYSSKTSRLPTIETIENCMKLSPMIVQALWEYNSPLLQLPHITVHNLKMFSSREIHVQTLKQLAQMPGHKRRTMLQRLTDQQYGDLIKVLSNMPYIHFQVNTEVIDDENSSFITTSAIVTVKVTLRRARMKDIFGDTTVKEQQQLKEAEKGKSKRLHSVHCPYYPDDKQEYWWTYICDRKSHTLLTPPCHVTNLVDVKEVQLRFTAPKWPGIYRFAVCLRSDSYLGIDQQQNIKLEVHEAPASQRIFGWERLYR